MKKLLSSLLIAGQLALLSLLPSGIPAAANVPCTVPFNLQNGTTADASQVMANYNAILTCLQSAAAAGVNSDITQLLGLTSPFTPSQGGTPVFIGGTSGGSANAQTIAATTPSGFGLTQNYEIVFKAGFTNSGATTLTVGSTATTNLFKQGPTGPVALTGNEIQAGQIVFAFYDGTQFEMLPPLNLVAGFGTSVSGGNTISISSAAPPYGFDQPVNLSLTVTQNTPSANLLQVCVTTQSGGTPSATSPVLIPFATASGGVTWLAITAAHCMNTNGAGASLGSANSIPFRFWIVEFNNAGTPVLALYNTTNGATQAAINPLDETSPQTTTAISAAALNEAKFYTPNGTSIGGGGAYFKILGYLEYNAGLATVGSYATAPTKVQLFGPGVKKPGDVVRSVSGTSTGTITPTSTINLIRFVMGVRYTCNANATAVSFALALTRSGTVAAVTPQMTGNANTLVGIQTFMGLDNPNSTSLQTYSSSNTGGSGCSSQSSAFNNTLLEEIQG